MSTIKIIVRSIKKVCVPNSCSMIVLGCSLSLVAGSALADYEPPNPAYNAPTSYYDSATGTGTVLKNNLKNIISTGFHARTYGDARYAFAILDKDPNNPSNILLVYNRASVPSVWDAGVTYNREHLWCVSWLGMDTPSNGYSGVASDLFVLRPCNPSLNSSRSNDPFGTDNSSGSYAENGIYWYPGDADAGEVARSLFYMATRWADSGLNLVELTSIPGYGSMQGGDLSSLLKWNYTHGVDNFERRRNQVIYSSSLNPTYYQGNRNPYIDHPEYVWTIFGGGNNNSRIYVGSTNPSDGSSSLDVSLGRVIKNGTIATSTVAWNKVGVNPTTFDITTSGDATLGTGSNYLRAGAGQCIDYNAQTRSLLVGLSSSTATTGLKTGTIVIDNTDLTTGGMGMGSADGNDTINVSASVLDHATPSFSGTLQTTLTIDFGIIEANTGLHALPFNIRNLISTPSFTAGLDLDNINGSGNTAKLTTDLSNFSALVAGNNRSFQAAVDTSTTGTFSAVYTLGCSDEDLPGANAFGSQILTLTLQGRSLSAQWIHQGDGNWSSSAHWVGAVPSGAGAAANFRTEISANTNVILDTPQTVGSITFDSSHQYTISGSNTLTLQNAGGSTIQALQGSHSIASPIDIKNNLEIDVASAAAIDLTGAVSDSSGSTLTKTGLGALNINSLTGFAPDSVITVSEGTFNLGGPSDSGGQSDVNIQNDAMFAILGGQHAVGAISGVGTTELMDNSQLVVTSIVQHGLVIGAGAKLAVQSFTDTPLSDGNFTSVPEPNTLCLLFITAVFWLVINKSKSEK